MEHRYCLRFETGERRGETIPITPRGLSVGRKPGNSLQILDNSVSGQHAELAVEADGVKLRDLGSTNGTRVGDQRVIETELAHGDTVVFGNIKLVFLDATIAGAPSFPETTLPAPVTAIVARAGEGLEHVSADVVARSKKVSPVGLVVLGVLVAGGGAAWWWLEKSERPGSSAVRPVEAVAGNLLAASYSFEAEQDGWEAQPDALAAFQRTTLAQVSGEFGLEADLAAQEFALESSPAVRAEPGHALRIRGRLRTSGEASGSIGIEFTLAAPAAAGPGPALAWSRTTQAREVTPVDFSAVAPPGYDSARAVVRAFAPAPGSVFVDDVSLIEAPADPARTLQAGDFTLVLLGEFNATAVLSKLQRPLVTELRFADQEQAQAVFAIDCPFEAIVAGGNLALEVPREVPPQICLRLRAEPVLVRAGIATIGADGYKTHGLDFERAGVSSLLLGSGRELVRFAFPKPVAVRGREDGSASAITARFSTEAFGSITLQLDFKDERMRAGDLAHAARNAEKRGDLGDALKQWSDLLNGFPFEEGLVTEAEGTRGRLIQRGLEEVRTVRAEVERARFFRLVDLFRQCRDKALAVGARYAGSEVEAQSQELAAQVEVDLSGLEADLFEGERQRLTAILHILEAEKSSGLAAEVARYLDLHLGRAEQGAAK